MNVMYSLFFKPELQCSTVFFLSLVVIIILLVLVTDITHALIG